MATISGSARIGSVDYPVSAPITLPSVSPGTPVPDPMPDTTGYTKNPGSAYNVPEYMSGSNGWNTYVSNDQWGNGDGSFGTEDVYAKSPRDWFAVTSYQKGNTAVVSYPDVQQLTNHYSPGTYLDVSKLTSLKSKYAVQFSHESYVAAQAAWDVWVVNNVLNQLNEFMVWVDTTDMRDAGSAGGAVRKGSGTLSGLPFTYYEYTGQNDPTSPGLPIIKLDVNQPAGEIDLLEAFRYFIAKGRMSPNAGISQINFGWEICSTGGVRKVFRLSDYSLSIATTQSG